MHIARGSCLARVGEHVAEGQVICSSGDVGFCPEPHLHIELHEAVAPAAEGGEAQEQEQQRAPSIPLAFVAADTAEVFSPRAGQWYSARGLCRAHCPLAEPLRSRPDPEEGGAAVEVADVAVELAGSRAESIATNIA